MKLNILVIGRNAQIMEVVLRLINSQQDWLGVGALTDDEGVTLFQQHPMDLVLIGGGVEESSEHSLSTVFKKINPRIKIVRHYGGGSGLLFNEILQATSPRPSPKEGEK